MATKPYIDLPGDGTEVDIYDELSITRGLSIGLKAWKGNHASAMLFSGSSATVVAESANPLDPGERLNAADDNYVIAWSEGPHTLRVSVEEL